MNFTLFLSGAVLILLSVFLPMVGQSKEELRVGDVFAHANPGNSTPGEREPFTYLVEVVEVTDTTVRVKGAYCHLNGHTHGYDQVHWKHDFPSSVDIKLVSGK